MAETVVLGAGLSGTLMACELIPQMGKGDRVILIGKTHATTSYLRCWRNAMNVDRAVMAFAGLMILISVVLTVYVSPWWLLFTTFIGLNMLQSAFTGFCPAAMVFRGLGLKAGNAFP